MVLSSSSLRVSNRQTRLPRKLVEELARATSRGHQEWVAAKTARDFKRLLPALETIFALKREEARCLGDFATPYDALLDEYEPGARSSELAVLFDALRSELVPHHFGPVLYPELQRIKTLFDPRNQLNPGKVATPASGVYRLARVDGPTRGALDRQIAVADRDALGPVLHCNGNGQCFDTSTDNIMCPSSKITRDRIHSPKGRAGMMREWLRLLSGKGVVAMQFSADQQTLYFGGQHGRLYRWDLKNNKMLPDVGQHSTWTLSGIALSPEGRYLATANADGTIYVLRLAQQGEVRRPA